MVSFPPFRLDVGEEQLWKGSKLLAVRRKPFAILRYLAANAKRLVTHEELLKQVWGEVVVSESSVRTHLHELRQVLGDGVIETVIGRGYRFVPDVTADAAAPVIPAAPKAPDRVIVGRAKELGVLRAALERAQAGQRQLCFVTGEPGIGKTTLVDAFLDELAGADIVAVRGQSVEQHSTPEAYRPVIEMLGQLRHSRHGDQALASLVKYAPTFLAQIPHLVPDAQLAEVLRRAAGGGEAKMVRELIEALEAVCMHVPLVVVLEDLQWSDVATIDLLALLGQRRERAKLLVIATSRHAEAQTVSHPLNRVMRTLTSRSGAVALAVERLDASAVQRLIEARFVAAEFPASFVDVIESITAGTPLFVTAILDDLVARGMIEQRDSRWRLTVALDDIAAHRPDNVKQLIDIQLDRLSSQEQRVLEAASLIGQVFPTALVAAALEISVEQADEVCDGLARRGLFLRHEGTEDWPEGTQQSLYGVTHGLVQEVCRDRSAPARRQRWHRAIAERLELGFGKLALDSGGEQAKAIGEMERSHLALFGDGREPPRADMVGGRAHEVATMLATHYEHGRAVPRAIHFHILAAELTARRFAYVDSIPSYRRALALTTSQPENRERDATELRILGGMGSAVLRNRDDEGESITLFERMIELARRLGDTPRLCASMVSLSVRYATLARYQQATAITAELVTMLESMEPALMGVARAAHALPLFWQGRLAEAIELLEPLTRPEAETEADTRVGILDPIARKTVLISYYGAAHFACGRVEYGTREIERAHQIAASRRDPYTFGQTAANLARVHCLRGDPPAVIRALGEAVLANSDAEVWHPQALLLLDWVRSHDAPLDEPALDEMMQRFRMRAQKFPMGVPFVALMLIDVLRRSGHADRARVVLDEMLAIARASGELVFEPELVRVRGELLEAVDPAAAAATYREAMANAEKSGAHWFRLRAALNLAQLERRAGPARLDYLREALSNVVEGDATSTVIAAKQLLQ